MNKLKTGLRRRFDVTQVVRSTITRFFASKYIYLNRLPFFKKRN